MEAPAALGRIGHALEGDGEGSRSLRSQPEEALRAVGDFNSEQFGPESGQTFFIRRVDYN
jgi:hypothetical protein